MSDKVIAAIGLMIWGVFLYWNISTADTECGVASYYHSSLHGETTASGIPYNENDLTAAHKELAFGTLVTVKGTNGKTVEVKINDRGPFVEGRIIDLSRKAAVELEMIERGIMPVCLEYTMP